MRHVCALLHQAYLAMTTQNALTVITRIRTGEQERVRMVLARIQEEDVETSVSIPFLSITSIHFARFVVIPGRDRYQLAFSSDYDGPLDAHLAELMEKGSLGMHEIYSLCEGYPGSDNQKLVVWLKAGMIPYEAFYIGTRARSVVQIRSEAGLRNAIQRYLDREHHTISSMEDSPLQIRKRIQEHIQGEGTWEKALTSSDMIPPDNQGRLIAGIVVVIVLLIALGIFNIWIPLVLLAAIIVPAGIFVALLRQHERRDDRAIVPPLADEAVVRALWSREDKIVQNQLTHIVDIKPGRFRGFTLRVVLKVINTAASMIYTQGTLGGIPSIHFARWVIIDNGTRLMFFSNFDGSWENYLGDFIDKAATGLTAVWSNTRNFPTTEFLLTRGATDEQNFKEWARAAQIPTDLWYSAYKLLTVENINNNTLIRLGLVGDMSAFDTEQWLRRL